jgi:hypothetical protein
LAPGIDIWVGAIGPCPAGSIPIGPAPSERVDGFLGARLQRKIVVLGRNIRPNQFAGNTGGQPRLAAFALSPASFCHRSSRLNGLFERIAKTPPRLD